MSSLGYPFISRAWATLSSSSSTAEGEDGIFTVLRMCAYVHTFYGVTIVHVFPHSAYLFVI